MVFHDKSWELRLSGASLVLLLELGELWFGGWHEPNAPRRGGLKRFGGRFLLFSENFSLNKKWLPIGGVLLKAG